MLFMLWLFAVVGVATLVSATRSALGIKVEAKLWAKVTSDVIELILGGMLMWFLSNYIL